MPKTENQRCGKMVDSLRKGPGKICRLISTRVSRYTTNQPTYRVKTVAFHRLLHMISSRLSPPRIVDSPLAEHYFYPVSTPPIITSTKGN